MEYKYNTGSAFLNMFEFWLVWRAISESNRFIFFCDQLIKCIVYTGPDSSLKDVKPHFDYKEEERRYISCF